MFRTCIFSFCCLIALSFRQQYNVYANAQQTARHSITLEEARAALDSLIQNKSFLSEAHSWSL